MRLSLIRRLFATGSNKPLEFPCLERLDERQRALEAGPEPDYSSPVQGYKTYHHTYPLKTMHGGTLVNFDIGVFVSCSVRDVGHVERQTR